MCRYSKTYEGERRYALFEDFAFFRGSPSGGRCYDGRSFADLICDEFLERIRIMVPSVLRGGGRQKN